MKLIITILIAIELVALIYTFKHLIDATLNKINEILNRCVHDKELTNNIASYMYFAKDLGPSTAAFSIVTLIVDMFEQRLTGSTVAILTIILFIGILLKQKSRFVINIFYRSIEKRKELWERTQEL
jgi:hypothetical protein